MERPYYGHGSTLHRMITSTLSKSDPSSQLRACASRRATRASERPATAPEAPPPLLRHPGRAEVVRGVDLVEPDDGSGVRGVDHVSAAHVQPTCRISREFVRSSEKNTRSPGSSSFREGCDPALYWSLATRGSSTRRTRTPPWSARNSRTARCPRPSRRHPTSTASPAASARSTPPGGLLRGRHPPDGAFEGLRQGADVLHVPLRLLVGRHSVVLDDRVRTRVVGREHVRRGVTRHARHVLGQLAVVRSRRGDGVVGIPDVPVPVTVPVDAVTRPRRGMNCAIPARRPD